MADLIRGEMDCECPIHGFASLGECTEKYGCDIDRDEFEVMASPIHVYDPATSTMVHDALQQLEQESGVVGVGIHDEGRLAAGVRPLVGGRDGEKPGRVRVPVLDVLREHLQIVAGVVGVGDGGDRGVLASVFDAASGAGDRL